MRVEDLTDEDLVLLGRLMVPDNLDGWLRGIWLRERPHRSHETIYDEIITAFSVPFEDLPRSISISSVVTKGVYKFRLEKGV